jgi:MFS family permease
MPRQNLQVPSTIFIAIYALNFFRIGYQTVAIAWFAAQATGRANSIAQILLASSIATLCMSPVIGRLVDSTPRKKALLCAGQSAVLLFTMTAIAVHHYAAVIGDFSMLIALTIALAGASLLAGGAMDYFLRICIPDGARARRIASMNIVTQIALITGTGAAGFAASIMTIETALIIPSLCAATCAILCLLCLPDLRVGKSAEHKRTGWGAIHAVLYFQFPVLFSIACCGALVFSIGQVTNMLLPGLIVFFLKLGSINYSTIEAAWSIGAFSVSACLAMMKKALGGGIGCDLLIISSMSVVLALVPFAPAFSVLIAMHFALGAGFAFVRIRTETRFLEDCPVHLLGRFRANSMALTSVAGLLIYCIPLIWSDALISSLYLSIAAVILVVAVILLAVSPSVLLTKSRASSK